MEEKNEKTQATKPSYEQLERDIIGLKGVNNQLLMQLQQMNMGNLFKRLDYLFKVIESGNMFKQYFLEKCIAEVESLMTVPEQEEKPETEDKE